ncbi:MAG: sigma-54-dependent Fis family transcriptional regulator [Sandaracinus sp.]
MTRLSLLVELASMLAREVDLDAWLASAADKLAEAMDAERATVWLVDAQSMEHGERGTLVSHVAVLPEADALVQPIGKGVVGLVAERGEVVRIDDARRDPRFDPSQDRKTGFTTRSILAAPIREDASAPVRGVVQVLNRKLTHGEARFDDEDAEYLLALATELARALALTTLAPVRGEPGLVLRGPFNRIVGRSPAMERVYERIRLAAQADATVLLRGETGTGKTLLARAVHVSSPRQRGPFVTVDCTTLPVQLAESELFGHERGAFTGADRRVRGKVELAHQGTLFLDEIGDLPIESQGKLLRFLQERTYERVGGRETMRADVRVLSATHHDLERAVREGRFRQDLYYRLRVLEIDVPPLRERGPDEIERLARHFAEIFGKRYGRTVELEPAAIAALRAHPFPGNVRELEHAIESATVLAPDGRLRRDRLPLARTTDEPATSASRDTRRAQEREPSHESPSGQGDVDATRVPFGLSLEAAAEAYVRAVVAHVNGNQSEAARVLGVSRNTVARALKKK